VPRPLDRQGQSALVFGTNASLASRLDLASIGYVLAQHSCILVLYRIDLVHTEIALFLATEFEGSFPAWFPFLSSGQC
jgi:hypothetical protein